jgi:hypothetical protein
MIAIMDRGARFREQATLLRAFASEDDNPATTEAPTLVQPDAIMDRLVTAIFATVCVSVTAAWCALLVRGALWLVLK